MGVGEMNRTAAPHTATLLWDCDSITPHTVGTVIIWNGYLNNSDSKNIFSLASEVESRSEVIREQILAFVYQVGMKRIGKRTVIETLEIRGSFSWWWMTLFALRRWHVNSNLFELARIYALRGLLVEHKIGELIVTKSTSQMERGLISLCDSLGVSIHLPESQHQPCRTRIRRICLPKPVLALATLLKEIISSACLKSQPAPAKEGGTCFFDYFNGLDLDELARGHHKSRFWGPVSSIAESDAAPNLWFHVFSPTADLPTACSAERMLKSSRSEIFDNHRILARPLGFRIIWRALNIYLMTLWKGFRVSKKSQLFVDHEVGLDASDLFWDEWIDSLRGKSAIHHALLFCQIEEIVHSLPQQRAAFFVMENQPWEIALQYAWRTYQASPMIGVPHAAAKFWELRHFVDPRSRTASGIHKFPEPDRIAVNSLKMRQLLESSGVSRDRLVDVEAASYAHLTNFKTSDTTSAITNGDLTRVLVFGDFNFDLTMSLFNALDEASKISELKIEKLLRSHPMCEISNELLHKFNLSTNNSQIAEQLANSDVVVATSTTSAAVEAFCLGIPVIIYLSADSFNFSPLRQEPGVFFATNVNELANLLIEAARVGRQNPKTYFNMEPSFAQWRHLLVHP
jgi:surface carbohydrate biosynthesis protein (TIGR04326 family)